MFCRSQRGGTLWTSSSEVRASPAARQAVPVKSSVARAKGGVLTGQLTSPAFSKLEGCYITYIQLRHEPWQCRLWACAMLFPSPAAVTLRKRLAHVAENRV